MTGAVETPPVTTAIRAQGVIDGIGEGLRKGAGVLVENDSIASIGPFDKLVSGGHSVVDLGDCVLVPGFVDAHSHITIRPDEGDQHGQLRQPPLWQALRGVRNLRRDVCSGVTTLRVMGEGHGIDFEFKRAVEAQEVLGPQLLVAGSGLSPSHGHGSSLQAVDGPDDLRKAVRRNIRDGADHIKIFATGGVSSTATEMLMSHYTRDEIRAVVQEASRAGRPVAAHAHGGEGVELCAEEGVASVEHGALLTGRNVAAMADRSTWLVLTNTILFHPSGIERGDADNPSVMAKLREARASARDSFARARRAGLRLAVGTDSMHGMFGYELEWLVEHGVDNEEALTIGTRRGAEVLGIDDVVGTLEAGKQADLLALAGNPLDDIRAVRSVDTVIKDGKAIVYRGRCLEVPTKLSDLADR